MLFGLQSLVNAKYANEVLCHLLAPNTYLRRPEVAFDCEARCCNVQPLVEFS